MNQLLVKFKHTINTLPLEIRSIILVAGLFVILFVWYYIFWQGLHTKISSANLEIKILEASNKYTQELLKNKKEANKTKLKTKPSSVQLISSQKMAEVFQDLLTNRYRLILIELQNEGPKAVALSHVDGDAAAYEHHINIKFQGSYFSTMNYLQTLEALGWRIFWDNLEYKVTKYPIAEVTLSIHTISGQKDLIDV